MGVIAMQLLLYENENGKNEHCKNEGEKMYIFSTSALSAFPDSSYVEKGLFVSPSHCVYLLDNNILTLNITWYRLGLSLSSVYVTNGAHYPNKGKYGNVLCRGKQTILNRMREPVQRIAARL